MKASFWEYAIVFLVVAASAYFVWRRFRRTAQGKETTCGCERGCSRAPAGETRRPCLEESEDEAGRER